MKIIAVIFFLVGALYASAFLGVLLGAFLEGRPPPWRRPLPPPPPC